MNCENLLTIIVLNNNMFCLNCYSLFFYKTYIFDPSEFVLKCRIKSKYWLKPNFIFSNANSIILLFKKKETFITHKKINKKKPILTVIEIYVYISFLFLKFI